MRTLVALLLGACALVSTGGAASSPPQQKQQPAQQPQTTPPPQRAEKGDESDVRAIVIDVVVRDRRGNPVTDLTAADFELFEDGDRQEIGSFVPIIGGPSASASGAPSPTAAAGAAPPSAKPGEAAAGASPAPPAVVALVFDRLAPETRSFVHKAAMSYVGDGKLANNIVAVFGVDISLVFYQQFTRDTEALRRAIEAAAGRSTSQFGTRAARTSAADQAGGVSAQASGSTTTPAAGAAASPQAAGAAAAEQQFSTMQSRMTSSFRGLERDQQGYTTFNSLTAIVSAMRTIPGRKSLVFFSEGLAIPSNVQTRFLSVIDAANRSNVSIYPIDAAGLRTTSTSLETREGLLSATQAQLAADPASDVTGTPMLGALEANEDRLRADPHSGLGQLADQTGGLLVANTNDLRNGFARVDTDMRNYYALTYVPKNTAFDGSFRRVEVKLRRSGLRVHARKGYYAVRAPVGIPVLGYEAPALAVLEQTPVPNAFSVRAAALRFPETDHPGMLSVLVDVPTTSFVFQPTDDKKQYTSDILVLVRFRDDRGQVVDKMSQRYQIQGPIDQIDRATKGGVLFYRQPELTPGVYSMETVVFDAFSKKASVRFATVDMASATDPASLRLSSLLVVGGSEKLPDGERPAGHPLYVDGQLLRPNLGEPLSKSATKDLAFYFVAYPSAKGGAVDATVELLSNAQPLATAPLQLGAPKDGRIAHVSRLPLEAIAPGTYQLRVTVRQGATTATRSIPFRVVS